MRNCFDESGFANAWDIFDQEVSSGQDARQRQLDLSIFSKNHGGRAVHEALQDVGHRIVRRWCFRRFHADPISAFRRFELMAKGRELEEFLARDGASGPMEK